jgi:hypothetical protein
MRGAGCFTPRQRPWQDLLVLGPVDNWRLQPSTRQRSAGQEIPQTRGMLLLEICFKIPPSRPEVCWRDLAKDCLRPEVCWRWGRWGTLSQTRRLSRALHEEERETMRWAHGAAVCRRHHRVQAHHPGWTGLRRGGQVRHAIIACHAACSQPRLATRR